MSKRGEGERLLYSHMKRVETQKFGTKNYTINLIKKTVRQGEGGAQKMKDGGYRYAENKKLISVYILEARE